MKTWRPTVGILAAAALLASAGCGVHYWQRSGADVQDFEQDSRGCVTEAKVSDFDNPPSPTEGQGATHSDAATEVAC